MTQGQTINITPGAADLCRTCSNFEQTRCKLRHLAIVTQFPSSDVPKTTDRVNCTHFNQNP